MPATKKSLRALLPARLETPRLILELYDGSPAHYEALLGAMNSPTTHARMGDFGIRTPGQFDSYNLGTRLRPAVLGRTPDEIDIDASVYYLPRVKGEGKLFGGVSIAQRSETLPPDAGWCLLDSHHGHGYAAEAARALLQCARERLGILEVMTWPGASNIPSVRTAEKAGFVRGGEIMGVDGSQHLVFILPGMDFERLRGKTISAFGETGTEV